MLDKIAVNSKEGVIGYFPLNGITIRFNESETRKIWKVEPGKDYHCELVHINITGKCNRNCEYCYVEKENYNMPVADFKKIIDKCVENKVFQITIGGGEPLFHPEIDKITKYASEKINMAVTTNGDIRLAPEIMKRFRQVNISYHEDMRHLAESLFWLKKIKVKRGINFIYYNKTAHLVDGIAKLAKIYGAEILLLQYKPVVGDWENYVTPEETYRVAKTLANLRQFGVAIDGATCYKCMMKKRFMTIGLHGEVYPCSFVHDPSMGNILTEKFADIWKNRGERILCPYMKEEDQRKL